MVGYLDFKPGLKTGSAPLQKSFPVKGSLGGPPQDAKWSAHLEIRGVNLSLKFIFCVRSKSSSFWFQQYPCATLLVQCAPVHSVTTGQSHWHLHHLVLRLCNGCYVC